MGSGGPDPAIHCGSGTPAVEIRSGYDLDGFHALADGDPVFVLCGGQGLRHVRIRVRAEGISPRVRCDGVLRDGSGALIAQMPVERPEMQLRAVEGSCESTDQLLIVQPPSAEIAGHDADIQVDLRDADGRTVSARRRVRIDTTRMGCE